VKSLSEVADLFLLKRVNAPPAFADCFRNPVALEVLATTT